MRPTLNRPPRELYPLIGPLFNTALNAAGAPQFLLRDEFTTADTAPVSSPRTCEPGPGTLTVTDTDNKSSISSGALVLAPHSTPAVGDPGVWSTAGYARTLGRSTFTLITPSNTGGRFRFGFDNNQGGTANAGAFRFLHTAVAEIHGASKLASSVLAYSANPYRLAAILRNAGLHFLIKGQAYTDWTLVWVDDTLTTDPVYAAIGQSNLSNPTISTAYLRVADLPAPWNAEYGIATFRDADAVAESTAITHEADFLMEFVVTTLSSASTISIVFREQDATHNWRIDINNAGDMLLVEDNAGDTTRITSLASISNGERVMVVAHGNDITVHGGNTQLGTYASATNFKTETSGSLLSLGADGVISDLITWPRTMSGAANAILNRYSA